MITPYYDSLLVKITAWGREFPHACQRMDRALREFRIRGVKTNIPFLENVVNHPDFQAGRGHHALARRDAGAVPLHAAPRPRHQAADLSGRGDRQRQSAGGGQAAAARNPRARRCRAHDASARRPPGTRQLLRELGPEGFAEWTVEQKRLLLTDTTFRDAHQSLLATRVRTYDMLAIANFVAHRLPQSVQPGDVGRRDLRRRPCAFCTKIPWQRLRQLREAIPNICFQMLLRASNAVGYTAYPDNVVAEFIYEAVGAGHRHLPHLRFAELAAQHEGVDGGGAQDAVGLRGGDLLHRRYSRSRSATSIRWTITCAWRRNWRRWARTCSPSRTWRACASPTRRRSW